MTQQARDDERAAIVAWISKHADEHPGKSEESRRLREELDWLARKIEHGAHMAASDG